VALTTKHRSSLYRTLTPIIGEEEVEALLSQFPARELDEPVTKEFVQAEIAQVRTEIAEFRAEVAAEFGAVRAEMAAEFGAVRAEMAAEHGSVRAEFGSVRAEFGAVRAEMAAEHGSVRAELGSVRAEFGSLRAEMAQLEARINDRFREQTMWLAGAMTVGMGLAAGIGTLLG
jgi:hypothetical protein